MWTIIKFDKNNLAFLKKDLHKKLGDDLNFYLPKLLIQKYKKNRLINKEFRLMGDYIFCFHKKFEDTSFINSLKFTKGLKYFLNGCVESQEEIKKFVKKCQDSENEKGYITENFYKIYINCNYKFLSGPFANSIFKIINLQRNKMDILLGDIRTTINRNRFSFTPL